MDYTLTKEEVVIRSWSKVQFYSPLHWIALLIFAATTYLSFYNISALVVCYVILFLVTALPKIYKMFAFFLIITLITTLIPPLGIILTAIFFLLRISYIVENWKALFAGVLLYAYPFLLANGIIFTGYAYYATPLITSLVASIGFHVLLLWLYHNKFSTKSALGAMGAAPLFFIMLVLPFIIQEISDVVDFGDFDDYHSSFNDQVDNYDDPGVHSVQGHWRQTSSGDYTYIDPYIRTNPDGIELNNISYRE